MKISTIIDNIDAPRIFVPAFQREYVWRKDDVTKFLSSILKGYPVGSILTWTTKKSPKFKGEYAENISLNQVTLLLDGQQRITTLYMLIKGEIPPYYRSENIKTDVTNWYVNIETMEFNDYSKKYDDDPRWIKVSDIFDSKIEIHEVYKQIPDDKILRNFLAIKKINDLEFHKYVIPEGTELSEAINIFYTVNSSGVVLTKAELALAQISGYWPEARDIFKAKLKALEERGFTLKLDFIVYALLGCLYHKGKDLTKLHSEDNKDKIRKAWKKIDDILSYVLKILHDRAYVEHTDEIGSNYSLIPIIVYCFDKKGTYELSDHEIKNIVKWFYYSQIYTRYTHQHMSKLDTDLGIIESKQDPFNVLINNIEKDENGLKITPDNFIDQTTRSPLFSMMLWYFKSKGAVCLMAGTKLHKDQTIGKKYQLEKDHIFSKEKLKRAGYTKEDKEKYALVEEITNRIILTQSVNRTKSIQGTTTFLTTAKDKHPESLSLQLIPEDEELWKIENYEMFLKERRDMLAEALNTYLDNITNTTKAETSLTLEEIIKGGETNEIEFKSSLRWCYDKGEINKKLEFNVLKAIAAFANTEGGTLFIGVNDNGEALGLDNDYKSMDGDKDKFQRHISTIITNNFDQPFSMHKIKISFPVFDSKEICRIDVKKLSKGKNWLFLTKINNNGQKNDIMYVRAHNKSEILEQKDMQSFSDSK